MNRQRFFPQTVPEHNVLRLSEIGCNRHSPKARAKDSVTLTRQSNQNWSQSTVHRDSLFALQVGEQYLSADSIGYTYQEDWIKFNFKLTGRGTTVLNGFGESEHNAPEVFITAGPPDMLKVDLRPKGYYRWVALCVPQCFFSRYLQLDPDALPAVLRRLIVASELPATAHRLSLTPDFEASLQSMYSVPSSTRESALYAQAKAVELSCLLLNHLGDKEHAANTFLLTPSRLACLDHAGELLNQELCRTLDIESFSQNGGFK